MTSSPGPDGSLDQRPDERPDGGLAARLAAATLAVDGVVSLTSGPADQFRTYLPGGHSVAGIRVDGTSVEVDVVARYGRSLVELGDRVAAALATLVAGRVVTVTIRDVVPPGEDGRS